MNHIVIDKEIKPCLPLQYHYQLKNKLSIVMVNAAVVIIDSIPLSYLILVHHFKFTCGKCGYRNLNILLKHNLHKFFSSHHGFKNLEKLMVITPGYSRI